MAHDNLAPFNSAYQLVAASASATVLAGQNGVGGIKDVIEYLVIIPATTSPGAVSIQDGALGAMTIFTGGSTSVADLKPIWIKLGARSTNGAWKVTTGANVSVLAVGRFS